MTANTSYVFAAYSDSTCSTLLATASSFTTTNPSLAASFTHHSGTTYTRTLTISGWTPSKDGNWYFKHQYEGSDECSSAENATTLTKNGSYGSGVSYTFTAYSGFPCTSANLIATAPAVSP